VTLDEFLQRHEPQWLALSDALARSRGRPRRLGTDGVLALGALYRSASADLAYARRRYPGDPVVARLEALVTSARAAIYGRPVRRGRLRTFAAAGYWERVAALRVGLAAAAVLLWFTFTANLRNSAGGVAVILAGVPIFWYFATRKAAAQ